MKTNQKGFSVIEVVIVLVVVGLLGVGGWYAWQSKHKNSTNSQATNSAPSNATQPKTSGKSLEISALGIKINDPDGRNLQIHAQKVCGASCDTKDTYFIRDSNDDYFSRCQYPVGISTLTENDAKSVASVKKIGGQNYFVHAGTSTRATCNNSKDSDDQYQRDLIQYVQDNMVEL